MSMILLLGRRLLATAVVMLVVGILTFLMIEVTPGDPASVAAGPEASQEQIAAARERLGLDDPLHERFAGWAASTATGDLGESYLSGEPVLGTIMSRLPITLSLTAGALLVGILIALPLGILAAQRPGGWVDRGTVTLTSLGIAAPEFFIGMLVILGFSLTLGWFPAVGYVPFAEDPGGWVRHLALPSVALGVGVGAELTRHVRASMRDVLLLDYVQTARAKGLSGLSITVKHALRNAALPVVTVLGLQMRRLVGGAVIIEQVFAINGLGTLAVRSVLLRDLPVLFGVAIFTALAVAVVNLLVDLSYGFLDPRVRVA